MRLRARVLPFVAAAWAAQAHGDLQTLQKCHYGPGAVDPEHIPNSDCQAWVDLFDSTGGGSTAHWTECGTKSTYRLNPCKCGGPPTKTKCPAEGNCVLCKSVGGKVRITEIRLTKGGLTGALPDIAGAIAAGGLSELTELKLDGNHLTGPMPAAWANRSAAEDCTLYAPPQDPAQWTNRFVCPLPAAALTRCHLKAHDCFCPAGKGYVVDGTGACSTCLAGRFQPPPSEQPLPSRPCQPAACPPGRIAPAGATNATANCTACPAGMFSAGAAAASCPLCPAGKWAAGGNATCSDSKCPAGTANAAAGATSDMGRCTSCAAGTFGPGGAAPCANCTPPLFTPNATACVACPNGTVAPPRGGGEVCTKCPPGKFASAADPDPKCRSSCCKCAAGKYAPSEGADSCLSCDCDPGQGGSTMAGAVRCSCDKCGQGTFSPGGATPCKSCPNGTIAKDDGSSVCTKCPAGQMSGDKKKACVPTPPTPAPPTPPTPAPPTPPPPRHGGGVGGVVAGAVVGALALAGLLFVRQRQQRGAGGKAGKRWSLGGRMPLLLGGGGGGDGGRESLSSEEGFSGFSFDSNADQGEGEGEGNNDALISASDEAPRGPTPCRIFTSADLREATRGFADENKLDEGTYGTVHHGKMRDGTRVAIKRLKHIADADDSEAAVKQFKREAEVLGKYRHANIVALLGYCFVDASSASMGWLAFSKQSGHFLVYELMRGGSLKDRLRPRRGQDGGAGAGGGGGGGGAELRGYRQEARRRSRRGGRSTRAIAAAPLTWQERLDIISDTARGLEYLHVKTDPPIIHQDIKSANILLGRYGGVLTAKVADFGAARVAPTLVDETHINTVNIVGTRPYMPIEYLQSGHVSEKTDAYAFGVVVCELLTGLPPSNPETKEFLANEIMETLNAAVLDPARKLPRMLDSTAGAWPLDKAATLVRIARQLLEPNWRKRSAVREVLMELDELAGRQVVRRAQRGEMYDPQTGLLLPVAPRGVPEDIQTHAARAMEGTGNWRLA